MAIGDRIRIISEEEYRIMTPPRHPRNERPAITIKWQRRQMKTMENTIAQLRLACDDKDKVIAGYDVQLSEAQETSHQIAQSAIARRERYMAELAAARVDAARLAYLEGYFYAKNQETAPSHRSPIYATSASIPGNQAQTYARQRERDPQDLSSGRQAAEGARRAESPGGAREGFSDQIRRQRRDHQADQERDAVEHVEITEGYRRPLATDIEWLPS